MNEEKFYKKSNTRFLDLENIIEKVVADYERQKITFTKALEDLEETMKFVNSIWINEVDDENSLEVLEYLTLENDYHKAVSNVKKLESNRIREEEYKKYVQNQFVGSLREILKVKKAYDAKGPIFDILENFNSKYENPVKILNELESQIVPNLQDEKDTYYSFVENFKLLWNQIYKDICEYEVRILEDGRLELKSSFSFSINEIIDYRYGLDDYRNLYEDNVTLSKLVPTVDEDYFFEKFLSIFSKNAGISFENDKEFIPNCPIYKFSVETRIVNLKKEYLEKFDSERMSGIRKSPLVDNNELMNYIIDNLKKYNKILEKESSFQKRKY